MDRREHGERAGHTEHTTVEHTTPLWRVVSVVLLAASIAALGFYLERVGHAHDFATVLVIATVYTAGFWARKRPDRVRARFGPFGRVADAIRESADDIRQYVYDRPMRVGLVIAISYGVAVVIAKYAVVAVLQNMYSWELAVALGAGIGAVAAAPGLFRSLLGKLTATPSYTRGPAGESVTHDEDEVRERNP